MVVVTANIIAFVITVSVCWCSLHQLHQLILTRAVAIARGQCSAVLLQRTQTIVCPLLRYHTLLSRQP